MGEQIRERVHKVALNVFHLVANLTHEALLAILGHFRDCGGSSRILLAQEVTLLSPELLQRSNQRV